jgi:hypothetical protein
LLLESWSPNRVNRRRDLFPKKCVMAKDRG